MPLKKSATKAAFQHNLKKELAAGRPKDQALAIAYSTQRAAQEGHRVARATRAAFKKAR